jgi:hypothetical protein
VHITRNAHGAQDSTRTLNPGVSYIVGTHPAAQGVLLMPDVNQPMIIGGICEVVGAEIIYIKMLRQTIVQVIRVKAEQGKCVCGPVW